MAAEHHQKHARLSHVALCNMHEKYVDKSDLLALNLPSYRTWNVGIWEVLELDHSASY